MADSALPTAPPDSADPLARRARPPIPGNTRRPRIGSPDSQQRLLPYLAEPYINRGAPDVDALRAVRECC
jgi:hypothetical protein